MLPPVNDTLPDPAVAVGVPPQVLVSPLGVATSRLAGKVSVNPTPVSATVLADGLVMVIVRALVPFTTMLAGVKALTVVGGVTTFRVAVLLVAPVPPSVEVIVLVVLTASPAAMPFTVTVSVHELFAARVMAE